MSYNVNNKIPGHSFILHFTDSEKEPSHLNLTGLLQVLWRNFCPVPQVLVHAAYGPQSDQPPFTTCFRKNLNE